MFRMFQFAEFIRIVKVTIKELPKIVADRNLKSVDQSVGFSNIQVGYRGAQIKLPLGFIDKQLNAPEDENCAFGNVREIYVDDVYLRRFKPLPAMRVVMDLGANRGVFSVAAKLSLQASMVIGVEPEEKYQLVFESICGANGILAACMPRITKCVSWYDGTECLSIITILNGLKLNEVDFVKCDIEGSEYDLITRNNSWLPKVKWLAVELHNPNRNPELVDAFRNRGFEVVFTDSNNNRCEPDNVGTLRMGYLYAARADCGKFLIA
jgi:hypothetical protein